MSPQLIVGGGIDMQKKNKETIEIRICVGLSTTHHVRGCCRLQL